MKTKTLSVRVASDLMDRIDKFETGTGIERASLVRNSVEAALRYFETHNSIRFPLQIAPAPAAAVAGAGADTCELCITPA